MSIGEEIDKLFLEPHRDRDVDALETIKNHIKSIDEYLNLIETFQQELSEHKQIHTYYKLKLQTLSTELQEIEEKSIATRTCISNYKKLYDEIKDLLVTIEIKPLFFTAYKHPNFKDLTNLKIALNVLKTFSCKYDIKAVNDKKEKIDQTLKEFIKSFLIFFQKRLNSYESQSRGELKIHQHIYDDVRKYEFVFDYCKEFNNENFVTISRKYLSVVRSLYEKEFEQHLKIVLKSLKEYKNKLKNKMEETLSVIVESFYLILACECNFVGKNFNDNRKFVNDFVTSIFSGVIEIIFDFFRDINSISSIYSINAMYNAKNITFNQEDKDLNIYNKFTTKLDDYINDFRKDYIRIKKQNWKAESKRKFYKEIIEDIKNNGLGEMNDEVTKIFLNKINDMQQDKKGKIEFLLYKLNFIYDFKEVGYDNNKDKIDVMLKDICYEFEKEVTAYLFGKDKNKIKERIKNLVDVVSNVFKDSQTHKDVILKMIKDILIEHGSEDNVKNFDEYVKKM